MQYIHTNMLQFETNPKSLAWSVLKKNINEKIFNFMFITNENQNYPSQKELDLNGST